MRKRGKIKLLGWTLSLLLLEVVLFVGIGIFVYKNVGNVALIEDMYAKKITLLIDNSKPGTIIDLDMREGAEIALKDNFFPEVTNNNGVVKVRLRAKKETGQSSRFYSNYKVEFEYLRAYKILRIKIDEK